MPDASWPGTTGQCTASPKPPFWRNTSEPHTPHASTRTRTSPGPGSGTGRCSSRSGAPGDARTAARMVVTRASVHQEAARGVDRGAGDVPRVVRGEEHDRPGHLGRLRDVAQGRLLAHVLVDLGREAGEEHGRVDLAGGDAVHGDPVRAERPREPAAHRGDAA